jgi:hypothetical protein
VFVHFALWHRLLLLAAASRVLTTSGPVRARRVVPQSGWVTALVLFLSCNIARADDPRSTYLIKLLDSSSQFRVRAQAAISLGTVENSDAALSALVKALKDQHPAVRAAAATSLGRVGSSDSIASLRALDRDAEEPVRSAARAAVGRLESLPSARSNATASSTTNPPPSVGPEMYYIAVAEPATRVSSVNRQLLAQARGFIKKKIGVVQGVRIAPDSEDPQAAERVLKQRGLKGFYLDSSIVSVEKKTDGGTRVAVSVIVATYPGRDMRAIMQGAATVTGAGDQAYNQAIEGAFNGALRQLSQTLGKARRD